MANDATQDMKGLLKKYRKNVREIAELKAFRAKLLTHKNPDPKVLAQVDAEIKRMETE